MAGGRALRRLAVLGTVALLLAGAALPGRALARPPLPVAVYVNVDEMSVLWPYRDPDTGRFPKAGEPRYAEYRALWEQVIGRTVQELKRRVPKDFVLFAARGPDNPFAVKIDVWIADLATSCNAPTFYKYLWVRTHQRDDRVGTNWDRLGVRSQTLVSAEMPPRQRARADVDAWVELWAQVPYLHLQPAAPPAERDYTPVPLPEAGP